MNSAKRELLIRGLVVVLKMSPDQEKRLREYVGPENNGEDVSEGEKSLLATGACLRIITLMPDKDQAEFALELMAMGTKADKVNPVNECAAKPDPKQDTPKVSPELKARGHNPVKAGAPSLLQLINQVEDTSQRYDKAFSVLEDASKELTWAQGRYERAIAQEDLTNKAVNSAASELMYSYLGTPVRNDKTGDSGVRFETPEKAIVVTTTDTGYSCFIYKD